VESGDFDLTWGAATAHLDPDDVSPTESLRSQETLVYGDGAGLELGTLPLLSVAESGELSTQSLLGKGGMGKVELAIQRSLRRPVALKSTLGEADDSQAQALLQEALVTGLLEHPNIVPVHQLGRSEADEPLLVMKRVEGVSWETLIKDPEHPQWGTLGEDRLREQIGILISVCNAVEFAHDRGILHRDIKPANVMVGAFGEVYLLDWGLAMRLDARPETPGIVGTPSQMAPEMLEGAATVDERTDVYLLGAALHTALTGTPRHGGGSLRNACYAAYRSLPVDYADDVPRELAALCNRATHVDPEHRPASAADFRRELERYLEHRSSIDLATEASAVLDELRELLAAESPHRERLAALFAESRFGFAQALRGWPANPVAREGLQACLTLQIERELAAQNVGLAESLLAELPLPAPQLSERVRAQRAELDAREARLRELEQQGDWRQGALPRLVFFFGMLGAGVVIWLWANEGSVRSERTLTPRELATSGALVLGALGAMVLVLRGRLLTNQVNARLVYGALLTGASIVIYRLLNCISAPPTATLISGEILTCGFAAALGGLLLVPWLWLQVPIWVAGAFAARLFPGYAGLCFAVAAGFALAVGAWKLHGPGGASAD